MSQGSLLDIPFRPITQPAPSQLSLPMLKKWLSAYGYPSTTAGPIIAATITIEGIQDLLHANGYPIEAPCHADPYFGPFEDSQFDAVVDVETSPDDSMETDLKLTDLDTCSEYGYCSSDLPDDEINFFQLEDLALSPDSPFLSDSADLDFGFDSGIEAEMDEPRDGSENGSEKKEKSESSDPKKDTTEDSVKEGGVSQEQNTSKPQRKNRDPEDKDSRLMEEKKEHEQELDSDDEDDDDGDDDDDDDENLDDTKDNDDNLPHFQCHYLWEFLHHILLDKDNKYIEWKNKTKGVFRLVDHNGLARLWGRQKNRKNMTYEKLSRALRYYYSKNILQKVPGHRLTYKFVHNLEGKKYPL
ncbi:ETS-related transcription factor Elf-4-like [Montipora foliosa]|uniref:ETS-related transcription factor Elf-4-like n=1 Tax=Montipora foliosa TaxID=591990 RepID=UPI0035F16BF6